MLWVKGSKTERTKKDQLRWLGSYTAWWGKLQLKHPAFIWSIASTRCKVLANIIQCLNSIQALMIKRRVRHFWIKPLGADRWIQSDFFTRHPLVFEKKGVQTPKLPLNGRSDSFIKPRMRHWVTAKHSGSSEFFVSLPLHSAICAVLCLKAELESGGHTSAGFRFQSVTHLWRGRDGWVWSKCHPKFCSYSMCSVAEKRRFLLLVFFIS